MPLLSVSYLSEITGLDRRKARARLESLKPTKKGTAHLYESRDALRLLLADATNGERLDPQQERAALDKARREQVETENRRRAGELLEADAVGRIGAAIIGNAKQQLLALPSKLATLTDADHQHELHMRARDEIHRTLTELADGIGSVAEQVLRER